MHNNVMKIVFAFSLAFAALTPTAFGVNYTGGSATVDASTWDGDTSVSISTGGGTTSVNVYDGSGTVLGNLVMTDNGTNGNAMLNLSPASGNSVAVTFDGNASISTTGAGSASVYVGGYNDASSLTIKGNTSLNGNALLFVTGEKASFTTGGLTVGADSEFGLFGGATMKVDGGFASSGKSAIEGVATIDGGLGVFGGETNLEPTTKADAYLFEAYGGTTNIKSGSSLTVESSFFVTGPSTVVNVAGTVGARDSDLGLVVDVYNGGTLNLNAGAGMGSSNGMKSLNIHDAVVNIGSTSTTENLNLSGKAQLNMNQGGNLTVANHTSWNSGVISMKGGQLTFEAGASFSSADAKIQTVSGTSNVITITDQNRFLSVGRDAVLDVSNANLKVNGNVYLDGVYLAGYSKGKINTATVDGDLVFARDSHAEIQISGAFEQHAMQEMLNDVNVAAAGKLVVLGVTGSISYYDPGYIYYGQDYAFRFKAKDGVGITVYGGMALDAEENAQNMIRIWNKKDSSRNFASNLITTEFANFVQRAGLADQDTLGADGVFNSAGLWGVGTGTSDYDALMLYNGSGLTLPLQAVIQSNRGIVDELNNRATFLRREKTAMNELASTEGYASDILNSQGENRVWATTSWKWDGAGSEDGFAGYKYEPWGVTVGYDRFHGQLAYGAAFSYNGGKFIDRASIHSDSDLDTYSFTAYAGYSHPSGVFVNAEFGYGYTDNKLFDMRVLNGVRGWNSADFNTNSWIVSSTIGYDWNAWDYLTITPSVGVSYLAARSDSHTQYFQPSAAIPPNLPGAGSTIISGGVKTHSTSVPLNLAAHYDVFADDDSLVTFGANVGYAYEFNDEPGKGRIQYGGLKHLGSVGIVGRNPGRHLFNLGVGGNYLYKQFEFGARYNYTVQNKLESHSLYGSFGINF